MVCPICGGTEFYDERHLSSCKTCRKASAASRYAEKGESIRAVQKAKRAAQPKRERPRLADDERRRRQQARKRRWEAVNPDKVKACKARSYRRTGGWAKPLTPAQRIAAVERTRQWAREHPERARQHAQTKQLNRRARKHAGFIERVDARVVYEMHGGRCGICGEFIVGDFHVDHVRPLARGGQHGYVNVQPAHPACNLRKGAREG